MFHRARPVCPEGRWPGETSVDAKLYPIDLDEQNDRLSSQRRFRGKQRSRRFVRFMITFCIGVAATLAWQSCGDMAREMIANASPQLGWLVPQAAPLVRAASNSSAPAEPAAPSLDLEELKGTLFGLAAVQQSVDQLAAQLAAGNQQIAGDIATLKAAQDAILRRISPPPPRPTAVPARNGVQ
jgi:hypothetical protein